MLLYDNSITVKSDECSERDTYWSDIHYWYDTRQRRCLLLLPSESVVVEVMQKKVYNRISTAQK